MKYIIASLIVLFYSYSIMPHDTAQTNQSSLVCDANTIIKIRNAARSPGVQRALQNSSSDIAGAFIQELNNQLSPAEQRAIYAILQQVLTVLTHVRTQLHDMESKDMLTDEIIIQVTQQIQDHVLALILISFPMLLTAPELALDSPLDELCKQEEFRLLLQSAEQALIVMLQGLASSNNNTASTLKCV